MLILHNNRWRTFNVVMLLALEPVKRICLSNSSTQHRLFVMKIINNTTVPMVMFVVSVDFVSSTQQQRQRLVVVLRNLQPTTVIIIEHVMLDGKRIQRQQQQRIVFATNLYVRTIVYRALASVFALRQICAFALRVGISRTARRLVQTTTTVTTTAFASTSMFASVR